MHAAIQNEHSEVMNECLLRYDAGHFVFCCGEGIDDASCDFRDCLHDHLFGKPCVQRKFLPLRYADFVGIVSPAYAHSEFCAEAIIIQGADEIIKWSQYLFGIDHEDREVFGVSIHIADTEIEHSPIQHTQKVRGRNGTMLPEQKCAFGKARAAFAFVLHTGGNT